MDVSRSRVCESGGSRRYEPTFRCTLQLLQPLRLEGGKEEVEDTNKIMQY